MHTSLIPTYSAIRESYYDILRGAYDLSVTQRRTPRRLSSYGYAACLIHTLRLGASKYEYRLLGRRHTSR